MVGKYAILVDGGFIKKKLSNRQKPIPSIDDIQAEFERIRNHSKLDGLSLLRIYFYDAPPATGKLTNPIDGSNVDLASHPAYNANQALHQSLELSPDVALRQGEISVNGWALGNVAMKSLTKYGTRQLRAEDFVPSIEQKGVDLRIGLDIARLSLRQLVDTIVVITGDSDMIPAFKFARREGVRIFLDHMGHGIKRELKVHADYVFEKPQLPVEISGKLSAIKSEPEPVPT